MFLAAILQQDIGELNIQRRYSSVSYSVQNESYTEEHSTDPKLLSASQPAALQPAQPSYTLTEAVQQSHDEDGSETDKPSTEDSAVSDVTDETASPFQAAASDPFPDDEQEGKYSATSETDSVPVCLLSHCLCFPFYLITTLADV
jgi:hypothetical protein